MDLNWRELIGKLDRALCANRLGNEDANQVIRRTGGSAESRSEYARECFVVLNPCLGGPIGAQVLGMEAVFSGSGS